MNRRRFISLLGLAAAGTAIGFDPLTKVGIDGMRPFFVLPPPAEPVPAAADKDAFVLLVEKFTRDEREATFRHFTDLGWMTDEVMKILAGDLGDEQERHLFTDYEYRVGHDVPIRRAVEVLPVRWDEDITMSIDTAMLRDQVGVNMRVTPSHMHELRTFGADVRSVIRISQLQPMAHMLADLVRRDQINVFARMPMVPTPECESAVAVDERSKLTLRGIRFFDHIQNVHEVRFEVLGGRA